MLAIQGARMEHNGYRPVRNRLPSLLWRKLTVYHILSSKNLPGHIPALSPSGHGEGYGTLPTTRLRTRKLVSPERLSQKNDCCNLRPIARKGMPNIFIENTGVLKPYTSPPGTKSLAKRKVVLFETRTPYNTSKLTAKYWLIFVQIKLPK